MKTIHGLPLPQTLEELLAPERAALVVYDMQVGIVGQVADAARFVETVGRALEAARSAGLRVLFTRHMSLPPELMGASAYRMAMGWQSKADPTEVSPWFLRGSPGFELTPEFQPRPSEAVFDKLAMSAFEGTPLAFTLRDCGVTTVAFAGIAMEIGIEPSARHAADLGFVPVIVADACGHGDAAAAARSIEALRFSGDTVVTDVAAFSRALQAA